MFKFALALEGTMTSQHALGLIGVTRHSLRNLIAGMELLLEQGADRVLYLGADSALDAALRGLLSASPGDVWERAARRCGDASAAQIDAFVKEEQRRLRYKAVASLPGAHCRTIELLSGKLVVLVHDKNDLEEEDILPASLLVFGRSEEPVLRQIGTRWFLSPGSLASAGVALLKEANDGVEYTLYRSSGEQLLQEQLSFSRTRVRVQP